MPWASRKNTASPRLRLIFSRCPPGGGRSFAIVLLVTRITKALDDPE
jgi:hypothetical protein